MPTPALGHHQEDPLASELGASQISTLLEALPGIANVLRSPVADALLNVIRAGARVGEFQLADAEELIRYATRRGLVGNEEGDRVLAEVREAAQKRAERTAEREKASKAKVKPKPKAAMKKSVLKKRK
jgi:urease accessory protein UreF